MRTFATTVPAKLRQTLVPRKGATIALQWAECIALAVFVTLLVAVGLCLIGLVAAAAFDPTVGCPATDTGCQAPVKTERH